MHRTITFNDSLTASRTKWCFSQPHFPSSAVQGKPADCWIQLSGKQQITRSWHAVIFRPYEYQALFANAIENLNWVNFNFLSFHCSCRKNYSWFLCIDHAVLLNSTINSSVHWTFCIQDHVICKSSLFHCSLDTLIPWAGTSSAVLTRSGQSRHFCLVPDFREKAVSLLSMMLALVLFVYFW